MIERSVLWTCVKIIKFKGEQFNPSSDLSHSIKFDAAFLSQHKEALAAAGYIPQSNQNLQNLKLQGIFIIILTDEPPNEIAVIHPTKLQPMFVMAKGSK